MTDTIHKAQYEKTIFYNPENDYCIVQLKTADRTVPQAARGKYRHRDGYIRFVASGYGLPRTGAVEIDIEGVWTETHYGLQLVVEQWEEIIPLTIAGIRGYLACGLIKGIGERTAAEIVARFGLESLNIIEWYPERLLEVRGISENRLEEIKEGFAQSRSLRSLMTYLAPYNVSPTTAQKIQNFFGSSAASTIRERPYELCRVSGFGFIRVDEIARKIGCRANDPMRIRGALIYILTESQGHDGHLYLPVEELCKATYTMLNEKILMENRVEPQEVSDVLCTMVQNRTVISDGGGVYLPSAYGNEDKTARKIAELITAPRYAISVDTALAEAIAELGVTPSPRQESAVKMAFRNNVSIITGSPGTGKTTVLQLVLAVFRKINESGKIMLAAPTGRASRRMAESTGFQDAKTLHSALKITSESVDKAREDEVTMIDAQFVIVDEFSMADMWLATEFFSRIRPGTIVLLVGDAYQLPSVGAGNVFRELIECGKIPVTVLNKVFRQAEGSRIAFNAKLINEDSTRLQYGTDFTFDDCGSQQQAAKVIESIYLDEVKRLGIEHVQILSPFKTDGEASAEKLNATIRDVVNPFTTAENEITVGSRVFRVGDRVMQTQNKKEISNGDLGFIREIVREDSVRVVIEFTGERIVKYTTAQHGVIELAYAMTIHKAMGSEFDVIIMPILTAHSVLLYRNVLYTAITRAKLRVHLAGQRKALMIAVHKQKIDKRNTQLGARIVRYLAERAYENERIA